MTKKILERSRYDNITHKEDLEFILEKGVLYQYNLNKIENRPLPKKILDEPRFKELKKTDKIIAIYDDNGVLLDINDKIEDFGYTRQQLLNDKTTISQLFFFDDKKTFQRPLVVDNRVIAAEQRGRRYDVNKKEWRHSKDKKTILPSKNGDIKLLTQAFSIYDNPKPEKNRKAKRIASCIIAQNITLSEELRLLEDRYNFIRGIYHDIKNPIHGIIGYFKILYDYIAKTNIFSGSVFDKFHDYMTKLDKPIRNLTILSKVMNEDCQKEGLSLNEILSTYQQTSRHKIQPTFKLDATQNIYANHGEIYRVINNLIRNSVYALIEKHGDRYDFPEDSIKIYTADYLDSQDKRFVELGIIDRGIGMDEQTIDNMFEKDFTTKGNGGSGLGMCIVKKILQDHGANMSVNSKPEIGTYFKIHFNVYDRSKKNDFIHISNPFRI